MGIMTKIFNFKSIVNYFWMSPIDFAGFCEMEANGEVLNIL